jgi:hypothetical protein
MFSELLDLSTTAILPVADLPPLPARDRNSLPAVAFLGGAREPRNARAPSPPHRNMHDDGTPARPSQRAGVGDGNVLGTV